jgi:hypothetical protein
MVPEMINDREISLEGNELDVCNTSPNASGLLHTLKATAERVWSCQSFATVLTTTDGNDYLDFSIPV